MDLVRIHKKETKSNRTKLTITKMHYLWTEHRTRHSKPRERRSQNNKQRRRERERQEHFFVMIMVIISAILNHVCKYVTVAKMHHVWTEHRTRHSKPQERRSPNSNIGSVLAGMFHNPYSIFLAEHVPWDMSQEIFRTFYGIYPLLKKLFSIHFARTNFRVLRKCPTWDIIPSSPFVSIK